MVPNLLFSVESNSKLWTFQKAEKALRHYKGYDGENDQENNAFFDEFERLKSISMKRKTDEKLGAADLCKF